jgi:hypothetical protein
VAKCFFALANEEGKILDYIYFEVRGSEADRNLLPQDEEGAFPN